MIKQTARRVRKKLLFLKNGFRPKIARLPGVEYFGTEYGGWPLVTGLLNESSKVFSFGLGRDISFDLAAIQKFGLTIDGFDPTPKSAEWISSQSLPDNFRFHQVGLADFDGNLEFEAPNNPDFVSYSSTPGAFQSGNIVSLPVKRLSTLLAELDVQNLDVLKMDIEGSEIGAIRDLKNWAVKPVQVLVEFHHRIFNTPFAETGEAVSTLESAGYQLFDISVLGDEFSFVLADAVS